MGLHIGFNYVLYLTGRGLQIGFIYVQYLTGRGASSWF